MTSLSLSYDISMKAQNVARVLCALCSLYDTGMKHSMAKMPSCSFVACTILEALSRKRSEKQGRTRRTEIVTSLSYESNLKVQNVARALCAL